MDIASKYDPQLIENKWYDFWMKNNLFASTPNEKPAYTIVIPPPNVTGVLHMGHMLNNTIQDVLIRRARMQGFNALWVPGTDHASIATEAKVVSMLKEKGIDKNNLSRDEFLKYAWEWKEKYGGIILQQLKKLGASCDWTRTKFTMDPEMSESVIDIFIDLYNKGLIYRGVRMVNWDAKALTAISDEEVIYKEEQSKLYYIRYKIVDEDDWITIATTRPETIPGDTAVCVHPGDDRYKHLQGKKAIVPLVNRIVPVIFDEYVEKEFGTGALKVTPAHDINDYNLGIKYHLDAINIFNDNGSLNENAQLLTGVDRFEARKAIIPLLQQTESIVKIEDYTNKVGYSERTNEIIEPKLSLQWFCKMSEMAKPALEVVMNNSIRFYPEKYKNTYYHWMSNVKDWCISRQLWWGHRIPAYYLPNKEIIVAKSIEDAFSIACNKFPELNFKITDLKQDEDVMDTWFSSWLWPVSVFDGIRNPDNEELNYYYPTSVLVTAPEIIFFWVARMIMAGIEIKKDIPFKDVYFTGIVRDHLRRKMSKQLGNSPDPILLMEKYGADGVRFGMLISSPAGNDLLFDESVCEQGRNFCNKIWNAFRLLKSWQIDKNIPQPEHSKLAINRMNQHMTIVNLEIQDLFNKYRISDAILALYKLIWDDFCSCYLEIIKPDYQQPIDKTTYNQTLKLYDHLMKMLHPFMPFITEEIWGNINEEKTDKSIMVSPMPEINYKIDESFLYDFDNILKVIDEIRKIRSQKNIPLKNPIKLFIFSNKQAYPDNLNCIISKLCNISEINYITEKPSSYISFICLNIEFFIPVEQVVNKDEELAKLTAELNYTENFLKSVIVKLSNERFVNNAPEQVVAVERKKQSDAEEKIKLIKEQILNLNI